MRIAAGLCAALLLLWTAAPAGAQARRQARAPAVEAAEAVFSCPAALGEGAATGRRFCDVLTAPDPADGIVVQIPAHAGPARLLFDLHNRHMFSEDLVRAGRAYARYTATIGVLTMNNDLVSRAIVRSEFRTAADLLDRITGGAGPAGLKAIAPLGLEPIVVELPAGVREVSLLGERLEIERLDGRETIDGMGRPVATISNVRVEYRPRRRED